MKTFAYSLLGRLMLGSLICFLLTDDKVNLGLSLSFGLLDGLVGSGDGFLHIQTVEIDFPRFTILENR